MADDLQVSLGQIGQLITIYALAYAIGSPLLISFTGNVDRRTLLAVGLGMAVAGNAITAFAPTYEVIYAARILIALGAAVFTPVTSTVAAVISPPEERGKAIALVFAGFTAATALGVPAGTYIGLSVGWRLTFGLVAITAGLGAIAALRSVPKAIETPKVSLAVFAQTLKNFGLVVVLLITLLQMTAQLTLFTYVTPYIQSRTDLAASGLTLFLLVNGIAGFFGNLWGGALSDRIGTQKTILLFLVLLAVSFAMFPLLGSSLLLGAIANAMWGAFGLGFNAPQQTRLVAMAPALASAVLGLNASFLYLGISLGSISGGLVLNNFSLDALPWAALSLTILTLIAYAFSLRFDRQT